MRLLIFFAILAATSAVRAADLPFDPAEWQASHYISSPDGSFTYIPRKMDGGEIAATLGQADLFPWPLASDRDKVVIDSLFLLGNVDAVWLANYDEDSLTVTRAAVAQRADGDQQWSRYEFGEVGITLDSDWFDQPLAILIGNGHTTAFGYRSRFESATPLRESFSGFSGNHAFSETDFDAVGARMVTRNPDPESESPAQVWPVGLLAPAGGVAFSYNYRVTPEPPSLLLIAIGGLCFARFLRL